MGLEEAVAALILLALTAYGVLGGADFGGGVWDLFAWGPLAREQREAIAHAMGPVWEANHVWLIFVLVLLFTGFPPAYAALSVALFVPFHLALLGIVLRGAAFVFRGFQGHGHSRPTGTWGAVFGAASTITPVLLGMSLSAVSAGGLRVSDGEVRAGVPGGAPWLTPLAVVMGALALLLCAYLAAVYLTNETGGALREDFRTRALLSGGGVVAVATLALPLTFYQAPHLFAGLLTGRALPVLGMGTAASLLSGWALLTRRFRLARGATVVQVACVLLGFGLAQYPYLIYPDLTLSQAAAPAGSLRFVVYTFPFGLLFLLPSLFYLFHVFKSERD